MFLQQFNLHQNQPQAKESLYKKTVKAGFHLSIHSFVGIHAQMVSEGKLINFLLCVPIFPDALENVLS